jgi:hypothetical protein
VADLGNLSGLFFSHQLQPDDDLEKAKFATRSEAARYAASIRWKGNVKGDDDGVDTPLKLAQDASVLRKEYGDFLDDTSAGMSGILLSPDEWQLYGFQAGDQRYVSVYIGGVRNTVPTKKLLQLEQKVCAIGERARALAQASVVFDEPLTEEQQGEINLARQAMEKNITEQSGGVLGGYNGQPSKAINIYHQDESFGGPGFYIGLHTMADWNLVSPKETEGGFMADLDEFFSGAKKVPTGVKKAYDALVKFQASDKTYEPDKDDAEPVPMSEAAIRRTTRLLLNNLNKSLLRNGNKWIESLTGKPLTQWSKERRDLGDPDETKYELAQRNEKKLADAYADVMRGMGIDIGRPPQTVKDGKYDRKLQEDVREIFPSRIVAEVQKSFGAIRTIKIPGGGSWNTIGSVMKTSGGRSTNLHEFMHAATYADPVLRSLENAFLERRRMGDPKRTREQYDVSERITALEPYDSVRGKYGGTYVKDQLSDPYAGRKYSLGGATESLTRGLEFLVADRFNSDDDDHKNFTLGALIMAGTAP